MGMHHASRSRRHKNESTQKAHGEQLEQCVRRPVSVWVVADHVYSLSDSSTVEHICQKLGCSKAGNKS
jgi:hypothetical protein